MRNRRALTRWLGIRLHNCRRRVNLLRVGLRFVFFCMTCLVAGHQSASQHFFHDRPLHLSTLSDSFGQATTTIRIGSLTVPVECSTRTTPTSGATCIPVGTPIRKSGAHSRTCTCKQRVCELGRVAFWCQFIAVHCRRILPQMPCQSRIILHLPAMSHAASRAKFRATTLLCANFVQDGKSALQACKSVQRSACG